MAYFITFIGESKYVQVLIVSTIPGHDQNELSYRFCNDRKIKFHKLSKKLNLNAFWHIQVSTHQSQFTQLMKITEMPIKDKSPCLKSRRISNLYSFNTQFPKNGLTIWLTSLNRYVFTSRCNVINWLWIVNTRAYIPIDIIISWQLWHSIFIHWL